MDPQFAELLRSMEEASHARGETPRIAREAGQFLNILIKATRAGRVLQVGVDAGYITVWLAEAVAALGGQLIAVEEDVWAYDAASAALARSPHAEHIQLLQGDTRELLPVVAGPFDLVLLTADAGMALHYFHIIFEQLTSGGLICCDKAMSQAATLADYLAYMHERPGLESVLAPVGEGIELTYKVP